MKKILLVEDDVDLFSLLKYNLEKEGFALSGLQTGKGALELCRQVRPDLILLDIMLPDSDGLDICKGIRKDADLSAVPIIFLTARASETDCIGASAFAAMLIETTLPSNILPITFLCYRRDRFVKDLQRHIDIFLRQHERR